MIANGCEAGAEFASQFRERRAVLVGCERLNRELALLALEQVNGARPDRSGGAQNRDAARRGFGVAERQSSSRHQSPNKKPAAWPFEAPAKQSHHDGGSYRCQKPIEPIHQAAMAGNELARVLGIEAALDRGFEQIAGLRDGRENDSYKDQHWGNNKPRELDDQETGYDGAGSPADCP